jgi:hypothetical protein
MKFHDLTADLLLFVFFEFYNDFVIISQIMESFHCMTLRIPDVNAELIQTCLLLQTRLQRFDLKTP